MPRTILEGVRYRGRVYLPGQEIELVQANLKQAALIRLEKLGIIDGFVTQTRRAKEKDEVESEPEVDENGLDESPGYVPVNKLTPLLREIDSVEEITRMMEADDRPSSKRYYLSRLYQLGVTKPDGE